METNFGGAAARRLPVYLVLDVSSSMSGGPIDEVNQGIQLLYNELLNDPQAIETAWISVITFSKEAKQIVPLTELTRFKPPHLVTSHGTFLGAALRLLRQAMDREIVPNKPGQKGDYKPLVFLMTDGNPVDEWQAEAQAIKERMRHKLANIIALGCGPYVNQDVLKQITEAVLLMHDVTAENMRAFFRWVSASVQVASVSAGGAGVGEAQAQLPPPPPGIRVAL
jgi:uncharacterized protein YegL